MKNGIVHQPKAIFLIDGLGAFLSAAMLFIIFKFFVGAFGLDANILRLLSAIAFVMSCFSLAVYFLVKDNLPFLLRTIGIINLVYCFLTVAIAFIHFSQIIILAVIYFFVELVLIVFLAILELKTGSVVKN